MSSPDDHKANRADAHVASVLDEALEIPRDSRKRIVPLRPNSGEWAKLEPLSNPEDQPTPFPMQALGFMQNAAFDMAEKAKCPPALAAASALGVSSVAAQGSFDLEFQGQTRRPLSLFLITVARSGERKSTVDRLAMIGVDRHVKQLRETAKRDEQANEISDGEPFPVLSPEIIANAGTLEGLMAGFRNGQPSQGLFSDEAGMFTGGYAMKRENMLALFSGLALFWDGRAITKRIRGTDPKRPDTHSLIDCRLACHLLGQRTAIEPLLREQTARSQGLLARCLPHEPESLMGQRQITVEEWLNPASTPAILEFGDVIQGLLANASPREADGSVNRGLLRLSPDATRLIVAFFNDVETKLGVSGEFAGQSDLLNKIHENAARIAGVIAAVNGETIISAQSMDSGITIAKYFLAETLRLSGGVAAIEEIEKAIALAKFLRKQTRSVASREISLRGPISCRKVKDRANAMRLLSTSNWIRQTPDKHIEMHPNLTITDIEQKGRSL